MLNEALIQSECTATGLPWQVQVVEEITSTSDELRTAAHRDEPHGRVLFAETQTAGRGRRENRWVTPHGQDLMVSFLLRPQAPLALWSRITTLAAVAIGRTIEEELPLKPQIKWPNDIYVHNRKVSGLLAEVVSTPSGMALILGIGINVNSREFPPYLADTAISLLQALPPTVLVKELDRDALAIRLLHELSIQLDALEIDFPQAVSYARERSWLIGKQIRATVQGQELYGRAMDINQEGHLILALSYGSLRTLTSAEGIRQVV